MLSRLGGVSAQKCKNQDFMYFKTGCMIFLFRIELRFQILLTEHLQNMRNEYVEFEINLFSRLGGDSQTNLKNENFIKFKRDCVITPIRWGVRPRFFFQKQRMGIII